MLLLLFVLLVVIPQGSAVAVAVACPWLSSRMDLQLHLLLLALLSRSKITVIPTEAAHCEQHSGKTSISPLPCLNPSYPTAASASREHISSTASISLTIAAIFAVPIASSKRNCIWSKIPTTRAARLFPAGSNTS
jgi:hypothetical protein